MPKVTAPLDRTRKLESVAWEWFAEAHPHEAHDTWPDRFWKFFHKKCPGISRTEMKRLLRETDEPRARKGKP